MRGLPGSLGVASEVNSVFGNSGGLSYADVTVAGGTTLYTPDLGQLRPTLIDAT